MIFSLIRFCAIICCLCKFFAHSFFFCSCHRSDISPIQVNSTFQHSLEFHVHLTFHVQLLFSILFHFYDFRSIFKMKNAKDKNVHVIIDSERHKKTRRKKDGVYVTVINIKLLLCKDNAAYSRVPRFIRHFNGLISAIMQRQNYCRDMK